MYLVVYVIGNMQLWLNSVLFIFSRTSSTYTFVDAEGYCSS